MGILQDQRPQAENSILPALIRSALGCSMGRESVLEQGKELLAICLQLEWTLAPETFQKELAEPQPLLSSQYSNCIWTKAVAAKRQKAYRSMHKSNI